MEKMSTHCQDCGAHLDIDLEYAMKFCPYCGAKILLDPELVAAAIHEQGKTKRNAQLIDFKKTSILESSKNISLKIKTGIGLVLLAVLLVIIGELFNTYMLATFGELLIVLALVVFVSTSDRNSKK